MEIWYYAFLVAGFGILIWTLESLRTDVRALAVLLVEQRLELTRQLGAQHRESINSTLYVEAMRPRPIPKVAE